jgi:tetratricopeptide (TPR) repeat protein
VSPAAARLALERLGHHEVLERLPAGEAGDCAALAGRALGAFGVLHRRQLERILSGLKGAPALRGRVLWLLGRRDEAVSLLAGVRDAEGLAYLGACLLGSDAAKAERALTRALRLDPARAEAWQWRAAARLEKPGRSDAALYDLDRRDALSVPGPLSLLLRAMASVQARRWKESAAAATALIALDPAGHAGWAFRSQARLGAGDLAAAEADYHEARDRDPDCDGFDSIDGGGRGMSERRMEARLRHYDREVRRSPHLAVLRAERAEMLREKGVGRFDLALSEYRALEPQLGRRAWFLAHLGRAEGPAAGAAASLKRLDRACRLFPSGGWLFAWRGEVLRRLGRTGEALRDLDRAAALQPWYGYAHAWRGAALQALGRWAESKRALDSGLAMGITYPADGCALHLRSLARARLGDCAGAVDDLTAAFLLDAKYTWPADGAAALRRARKARPRHAWTAAWSAHLLLASGDAAGAERALSSVLAREPGHAWARIWRAEARLALGRGSAAESDLRAAPGLCRAGELLAATLAARGRLAEALRVLDRCARSNPTSTRFFALRADVLRRLGRHAPAVESARAALALDPGFTGARAILAASLLELGRVREADLALKGDSRLALALREAFR